MKRVEKGGAGGALAGQNTRLHADMDGLCSKGRIEVVIPDHFDRSRLNNVAASIEATLIDAGIRAECSDLFSHLKIELSNAQLAAASTALADLQLI